jgi:hypothetical protein
MKTVTTQTKTKSARIGGIVLSVMLAALIGGLSVTPARAYDDRGRHDRGHDRGHRDYHPGYGYGYGAPVYAPPPVYYAPPVVGPPAIDFVFPLRFR